MLLQDMIQEADLLVPNALSTDLKLKFVNEIQRKMYRDFPQRLTSFYFQTVPNTALYVLPTDCTEENVESVYVDSYEYEYQSSQDNTQKQHAYTLINGQLFLYPTPLIALDAYVTYRSKPADLTTNDLQTEPLFLPDFPELIIYGLASKLELINRDFSSAEVYDAMFKNVATQAIMKIKRVHMRGISRIRKWR